MELLKRIDENLERLLINGKVKINRWYIRILIINILVGMLFSPYYLIFEYGLWNYLWVKTLLGLLSGFIFVAVWAGFIAVMEEVTKDEYVSWACALFVFMIYLGALVAAYVVGMFVGFDGFILILLVYLLYKYLSSREIETSRLFK